MSTSDHKVIFSFDERITETALAVLVEFDGREIWLPKRLCEVEEDDLYAIIPSWLMIKNELESYCEEDG